MSNQDFCLCLSTQKFFSLCNWQGQIEAGDQKRLRASNSLGLGSLEIRGRQKRAGEKIAWQSLSVQKFFSLCNWQGETEAGEQRAPLPLAQTAWQCRSVKEVFSFCNWQGIPSENRLQQAPSSRLKEQVTQFFQFFPWEGNPDISSLPDIASIASPFSAPVETTFTDLSELF